MSTYTDISQDGVEVGGRFEKRRSDGSFSIVEPRISTLKNERGLVSLLAKENPDSLIWRNFDSNRKLISESPFIG